MNTHSNILYNAITNDLSFQFQISLNCCQCNHTCVSLEAAHALLQRQVEEEREVRAAQEEHVLQLQQALEEVKATQQGQLSHRQQVMEQLEIDQRKQVSQIQKEVQLLRSLVTDVVVVLIAMVVLLAFTYLIWL